MKRSKTTALLLMSSVPLLLTACSREPEVEVREGLYTSVEACTTATGDPSACRQAFEAAQAQAADSAPQYASREQCAQDYDADKCVQQRTSAGTSFFGPMMMGFFMGQMLNGGSRGLAPGQAPQAPQSAPAYQDRNKGWARATPAPAGSGGLNTASRIGTGKAALQPTGLQPNAAPTVSRGGFGSSARGRSSVGG